MRISRASVITFVCLASGFVSQQALAVTQKASDAPKIKVTINTSLTTASQLVLDVSLPGKTYTKLVSYKAPDGKTYYKVAMPGLTTSFDPTKSVTAGLGRPGIPALSIPFAIPEKNVVGGMPSYADVTTEILSASFNDVKVSKDIFPASTQPLDSAAETALATTHLYGSCAIFASSSKLTCWGLDDTGDAAPIPINGINKFLSNPMNANGAGIVANTNWRALAVGMDGLGGKSSPVCLIGEPAYTGAPSTVYTNSMFCAADTSNFSMAGIGTSAGETPPFDIQEIGASDAFSTGIPGGAAPIGSEFCMLRKFGSSHPWFNGKQGHGEIKCFGRGSGSSYVNSDWSSPPLMDPITSGASRYTQLSVGSNHACAILETGRPRCWGADWQLHGATMINYPQLSKVEAGFLVDCGIKSTDNKLTCWGLGTLGNGALTNHPLPANAQGAVRDISIGEDSACIIDWSYKVKCFAFDYGAGPSGVTALSDIPATVTAGTFKSVEVGGFQGQPYACAVSTDDKVSCWGKNDLGQFHTGATDVPDIVSAPTKWNDPIFDDFIPAKLYEGMDSSLVRPFVKVPTAYTAPTPVPSGTVTTSGKPITGSQTIFKANPVRTDNGDPVRLRGLGLGQLYLYGGQYTASSKKLRVFSKVRVKIKFANPKIGQDGKADYGLNSVDSAYNQSFKKIYGNILANADIALANLTPPLVPRKRATHQGITAGSAQCGEEMLVVSHSDFASATDSFVAGKNAQGMLTRAVYVGDPDVGSTADSIRNFVQGEFSKTNSETGDPCVAPSYLTLIGNTDHVPTFTGDTNAPTTPGDIDYSLASKNTYVPDLAVGRLPAADSSAADTMVNKILAYETATPSSSDAFFKNITITSFFQNPDAKKNQDQRGFIRTSEQLRAALIKTGAGNPGKTVERLYSTSNPTGSTKLMKDDLGRAFPKDIQKTQKQAPWISGSQATVVNSVKAGRTLLISRDHGNFDRIFNPAFGSFAPNGSVSSVSQMSNGPLAPVAWLIACLSGRFDDPLNPSFAEAMLAKDGGGMVGVLAASRESPSEVNNSLTMALADAVWPSVLPTGSTTPVYRMGDVLNAAKIQVLMSGGPSASVDINNEMRLYNWFGDPSMPLWVAKPAVIATAVSGTPSITPDGANVKFTTAASNGATAVLINTEGMPIGKATVASQGVSISPSNGVAPAGRLRLVLSKDGSLPTVFEIRS